MRRRYRPQQRWVKGKNFHKRFKRRGRPRDLTYTIRNPQYRDWKKRVHCRDGHRCQLCHKHRRKGLHAHHIRKKSTHPEIAFSVSNGISLCKRCHKMVDGIEERFESIFDLAIECGQPLPYSFFVWFNSVLRDVEPRYCKCGCGQTTRFDRGRHARYTQQIGNLRRQLILSRVRVASGEVNMKYEFRGRVKKNVNNSMCPAGRGGGAETRYSCPPADGLARYIDVMLRHTEELRKSTRAANILECFRRYAERQISETASAPVGHQLPMIQIQTTRLLFEPTDQLVDALICPLTAELIDERMQPRWWQDDDLKQKFEVEPIDRHWDWHQATIDLEGRSLASEKVAIVTGDGEVQGAMLISREPVALMLERGQSGLFVELLFTAPRNRPALRRDGARFFIGIGKILLAWGTWFSRECGYNGRLRLDGSPDFLKWYVERGFKPLGIELDAFEGIRYTPMELPVEAAERLIESGRMPVP